MSIFFVRHTQSEANQQNLLGGQKDYALSAQGVSDALSIAGKLDTYLKQKNKRIQHIISSPLLRARETAEQLASVLKPEKISQDVLLLEQAMGKFTGMSYAQLETEPDYVHDRTQRWLWQPPASPEWPGESYCQIAKRVSKFFQNLQTESDLLIVSHAVTMRLIYGYLHKMFPEYLEQIPKNGEVWEVEDSSPEPNKQLKRHLFCGNRESRA